jgi:hypothetical protein
VAKIVALDADAECIPAMVGNLRAAALTGAAYDHSIVIAQQDVRADARRRRAPAACGAQHAAGCLLLQPAYGVRIGGEHGEEELLALCANGC